MTCEFCGETDELEESSEITEYRGGDESMSLCEGCYDHMYA